MRQTHTYAIVEISAAAYAEIRAKLVEANYDHLFSSDGVSEVIDMNGLALAAALADGPPMFQRVESTNVWAWAYTPANQTLHVQFKSGGSYTYGPVSPGTAKDFGEAPSKGGFIAKLKNNPDIKAVFVEDWKARIAMARL